jgi:hypothetical protein
MVEECSVRSCKHITKELDKRGECLDWMSQYYFSLWLSGVEPDIPNEIIVVFLSLSIQMPENDLD